MTRGADTVRFTGAAVRFGFGRAAAGAAVAVRTGAVVAGGGGGGGDASATVAARVTEARAARLAAAREAEIT